MAEKIICIVAVLLVLAMAGAAIWLRSGSEPNLEYGKDIIFVPLNNGLFPIFLKD